MLPVELLPLRVHDVKVSDQDERVGSGTFEQESCGGGVNAID